MKRPWVKFEFNDLLAFKTKSLKGHVITLVRQKSEKGEWWNLHARKSNEVKTELIITITDLDELETIKFAEEYLEFVELI